MKSSIAWLPAAILAMAAGTAEAQFSVTLYGGYAASEGIDNVTTGTTASVESAPLYAVAFDYTLDPSRELQVLYAQQNTQLAPGGGMAPFDFTLRYLHVGGTFFFDGPIGTGPFAVGGLGATQMTPALSGLSSETRPSLNLGIGYQWALGKSFAVRAEARAFMTLINSSSGLFCSGGCVVVLSGDALLQGAAMLGISGRF